MLRVIISGRGSYRGRGSLENHKRIPPCDVIAVHSEGTPLTDRVRFRHFGVMGGHKGCCVYGSVRARVRVRVERSSSQAKVKLRITYRIVLMLSLL